MCVVVDVDHITTDPLKPKSNGEIAGEKRTGTRMTWGEVAGEKSHVVVSVYKIGSSEKDQRVSPPELVMPRQLSSFDQ